MTESALELLIYDQVMEIYFHVLLVIANFRYQVLLSEFILYKCKFLIIAALLQIASLQLVLPLKHHATK